MLSTVERDIIAHRNALIPLVNYTKQAIGDVVTQSYDELLRESGNENPFCRRISGEHFPLVERFRYATLPQHAPVRDEQTGIEIVGAYTATLGKELSRNGIVLVTSPLKERLVTVQFNRPDESPRRLLIPREVKASAHGWVVYDGQPGHTIPKAKRRRDLLGRYGYHDSDHLAADYSKSMQGAIGATLFVASAVDRVFGIQVDTSHLSQLQALWQRKSPQSISPALSSLLPK